MFYRVFGPAGSGKKEFVFSLAKKAFDAKEKVFLIVPEQMTAQIEGDVVRLLGNSASLFVEVTNFSRLANVVLRTWGDLAKRAMTEEEKRLIFSRILKKNKSALKNLPARICADTIDFFVGEWEEARRAGLDEEAARILSEDKEFSPLLKEKLSDLHLMGAALKAETEGKFSDPAGDEEHLAQILTSYPFFRGCTVLLYGFWDFTAPQEALIRRFLAQAKTLAISFTAVKKEKELFEKSLTAANRCLRFAREAGVEVRDETCAEEERDDALFFLKKHFASLDGIYPRFPENLSVTSCPTAEDQARFVARTIRKKVMEGAAWKDFAVLFPDEGKKEVFALTLEAEGIPVFFEKKKDLATSSLAKTLLLAVKIASLYASEEVVREYLNRGYFLCEEESRFLLEKYVCTWSLSGRSMIDGAPFTACPEGYTAHTPKTDRELEKVNRAKKKIFDPIRKLSFALAGGTNKEKIASLVVFLREIGCEERLKKEVLTLKEKGEYENAAEKVRVWNCILTSLSGVARTAGDETESAEDFAELLSLALSCTLPGLLPTGQDRVSLGVLGFSRFEEASYIFVTDLTAGVFPPKPKSGRFFTDEERFFLSERGYPLAHPEKEQNEAAFYLYLAVSAAKKGLFLSFVTKSDEEGGKGSLSLLVKRILPLFPRLCVTSFSAKDAAPLSRESAFRYLMKNHDAENEGVRKISEYFLSDPKEKEALLSAIAGKSFRSEESALTEVLPFENENIQMSYSRLQTYSRCRFSYFARYLLDAKERRKASLAANITGSFVHRVMEKVFFSLSETGRGIGELSHEELKTLGLIACDEAFSEICPEGTSDARLRLQYEEICKSALLILSNLQKEFKESQFTPIWFEKELSDAGGPWTIPLSDGTNLSLIGTIDRVDRYVGKNGKEYVRVVDYKTGSQTFRLEDVANGLDLQMLLYLFALWGRKISPESESGAEPAGVLYVSGMGTSTTCDTKKDLEDVAGNPFLGLKREGLFVDDEELLRAGDPQGNGLWIPVNLNKNTASGRKNLISMELLGRLKRKTERDFARLAEEIKEGRIETNPIYSPSGSPDPCRNCEMMPICKRSENARRPYLKRPTEEDIFGKKE